MPLFSFDHFQLSQLSMAARTAPSEQSPIFEVHMATLAGLEDGKITKESSDDLIRLGLLKHEQGALTLAPELEPVFFILHHPEKVWRFYRQSQIDEGETFFCWRSGAAVRLTIGPSYAHFYVLYPYTEELSSNWFTTEFTSGIEMVDPSLKSKKLFLDANEMLIVTMLQALYKQKVDQNKQLTGKDLWIDITELTDFTAWDQFPEGVKDSVGTDDLGYFVKYSGVIARTIAALKVKGVLNIRDTKVSFSKLARQIFDPGRINDLIQVTTHSTKRSTLATLYVLENGYLLQSPVEGQALIKLSILPNDMPKKQLLNNLLSRREAKPTVKRPITKQKAQNTCPNCHKEVPEGARFCRSCGAQLGANTVTKPQFCRKCGGKLKANAAFCPSCGEKLK